MAEHVRDAGRTWCDHGDPWPCPQSAEGRWQALRAEIDGDRLIYAKEITAQGKAGEYRKQAIAAGYVDAYDKVLAKMTELEG